jgi:hypothetical protein
VLEKEKAIKFCAICGQQIAQALDRKSLALENAMHAVACVSAADKSSMTDSVPLLLEPGATRHHTLLRAGVLLQGGGAGG